MKHTTLIDISVNSHKTIQWKWLDWTTFLNGREIFTLKWWSVDLQPKFSANLNWWLTKLCAAYKEQKNLCFISSKIHANQSQQTSKNKKTSNQKTSNDTCTLFSKFKINYEQLSDIAQLCFELSLLPVLCLHIGNATDKLQPHIFYFLNFLSTQGSWGYCCDC